MGIGIVRKERLEVVIIGNPLVFRAFFGAVKRWLRDEEVSAFDEFRTQRMKCGDEQRRDVCSIDIGISKQNDFVVTQ